MAFDIFILLKLVYKIRNKENNIYEDKRLVGKTLKMDENNQYRNAMTKAPSKSSIKRSKKTPAHREFNKIMEGISDEHIFATFFALTSSLMRKKPLKTSHLQGNLLTDI